MGIDQARYQQMIGQLNFPGSRKPASGFGTWQDGCDPFVGDDDAVICQYGIVRNHRYGPAGGYQQIGGFFGLRIQNAGCTVMSTKVGIITPACANSLAILVLDRVAENIACQANLLP